MAHTKKKYAESNFFNDVYDVVKLIPKGRVTSYGCNCEFSRCKIKRTNGRLGDVWLSSQTSRASRSQ